MTYGLATLGVMAAIRAEETGAVAVPLFVKVDFVSIIDEAVSRPACTSGFACRGSACCSGTAARYARVPCRFLFKAIGRTDGSFAEQVVAVVRAELDHDF